MRSSLLLVSLLLSACQAPVAQDHQSSVNAQTSTETAAVSAETAQASAPAASATRAASEQATEPVASATAASASAVASVVSGPQASAAAASSQPPASLTAEILDRYPHDSGAFTQGLQYVERRFLESTGMVGESGVRWVNPKTGEVEQQVPTPNPSAFGEGAAYLNGQVYHITWQTGEAYRFDQALALQETYTYQGEGWGLTHDGQELIMSDGSATLFFRDPDTFKVTHELTVTDGGQPVTQLNELEWADGSIWANVWMQERIARIDPQTGQVTGWLDVAPLAAEAAITAASLGQQLTADDVPNGIAYNDANDTFFLTGKRWPVLFEVKVK